MRCIVCGWMQFMHTMVKARDATGYMCKDMALCFNRWHSKNTGGLSAFGEIRQRKVFHL